MKFWDSVGDPSYSQRRRPAVYVTFHSEDIHLSFRRYSPLSVEIAEKLNKRKSFMVQFFYGGRPELLYGRLLARFTVHHLAKFG